MLLKFFRKKKNMKRIVWGLAILIIPAFVIWGAGTANKKKGKGPDYAGKVFGEKISFDDYINMWRVTRDNATRSFGANIPVEFIDQLTWNRIILLKEAGREKIAVKNDEVVERIISFPIFQRSGSFDKKLYKSALKQNARGFEEKIRDDIRITKLREKVTSGITVTDIEVEDEYKKKFEKVQSSYISIPFSDLEKDVVYEKTDLLEFYENNKETFRRPDEINIRYIEVLLSSFDKEVYITEDQIQRYFEEHTSDYKKPDSEETPILDETIKKTISEKLARERKTSLAEELGYKVIDGVLKKKDLDTVSASFALEVKETGFFNMQQAIPGIGWSYGFTKRGFELGPNEISNILIKGENGFYIIQLKERKKSYIPEFKDAEDQITKTFVKNESGKLAEKKAKKVYQAINNKIKKGASFEDASEEIGLSPQATDLIARDGYIPSLGPARDFVEASLSLKNEAIGGPLKMMEAWVILKLDKYEDIDEIKFIEEKEAFKEKVLSRKKDVRFDEWFQELKGKADFVSYTLE